MSSEEKRVNVSEGYQPNSNKVSDRTLANGYQPVSSLIPSGDKNSNSNSSSNSNAPSGGSVASKE